MNAARDDPLTYLKLLWRWRLLFAAFLVGFPLAAFVIAANEAKVYESSVLMQEEALPVDTSLFTSGTATASSATAANETLSGLARVIDTPSVAQLAAARLTPVPADPSALLRQITATADVTTGFITISAKAARPQRAADVANAFGHAVVALRAQQADGLLTTAIDQVSAQLTHIGSRDAVGRAQLSGQLQRFRALRAAQGANAQILQAAVPDTTPVSPRILKIVGLGVLAGLLVGLGAVLVAEASDRRVRHPEDLEELTGLRLLAVIPRDAFIPGGGGQGAGEAFHMLRSALMYFSVDQPLSTVVISSPGKGDGKTMVATQLAVAAAEMGRDVILVDADLRRPQVSSRLGIDGELVNAEHGLAAVLTGQAELESCLVDLAIGEPDRDGQHLRSTQRRVRVLPAGGLPPNPSELIGSERMRDLLGHLAAMTDLVVIDTNPLLMVSDSLPLLDSVSGVVLVARLGTTTRDVMRRLQNTVSNTNAKVLGVVATGAPSRLNDRYGYGYGSMYESNGNGNGNGRHGFAGLRDRRRKAKQLR